MIFTSWRKFEREISEYMLKIDKFLRCFEIRMEKCKQKDWRVGDLLQISQESNVEVMNLL